MDRVLSHTDLDIYKASFEMGMEVFNINKSFPKEEIYSLTDQIRRSSRPISGNLAEAWRKRRYKKAFIAKLSDAEGETAETQVWLEYALACGYIEKEIFQQLNEHYNHIIVMIVNMIKKSEKWTL